MPSIKRHPSTCGAAMHVGCGYCEPETCELPEGHAGTHRVEWTTRETIYGPGTQEHLATVRYVVQWSREEV